MARRQSAAQPLIAKRKTHAFLDKGCPADLASTWYAWFRQKQVPIAVLRHHTGAIRQLYAHRWTGGKYGRWCCHAPRTQG